MENRGAFWKLELLSDRELIEGLGGVLRKQQHTLGELVAHLGELEERRLHLLAAHPSLFDDCVSRLRMSEDEACRRIELARLARRFPALFPVIASGEITLSVALLLKPVLTPVNHVELIAAVRGQTIRQAREILAALFPSPDAPSRIRKLPEPIQPVAALETPLSPAAALLHARPSSQRESPEKPRTQAPSEQHLPARAPELILTPPAVRSGIEPIAARRYKVQFTADASLKEKLEVARDLLRHTHPNGDLAPIVSRALDLLISDLKRARFGVGARPKVTRRNSAPASPATSGSASSSHSSPCRGGVSRATRRVVLERDGLGCTWADAEGKRCGSRAWLELDHQHPRGKGGGSEPANVRILCRAHNQLAAERAYGREHMARARAVRRKKGRQARFPPIHAASPDG